MTGLDIRAMVLFYLNNDCFFAEGLGTALFGRKKGGSQQSFLYTSSHLWYGRKNTVKERKTMKKLISLLLAALMLLSLCASAFAEEPVLASTKSLTALLDSQNLNYTCYGLDDDGDDHISIGVSNDDLNLKYTMELFFSDDLEAAYVYVWYLISYSAENQSAVTALCNEINSAFRYATFVADDRDNTVTVKNAAFLRSVDDAGAIVFDMMTTMASVIDEVYPYLAEYAN